jgi:hypothetical protein
MTKMEATCVSRLRHDFNNRFQPAGNSGRVNRGYRAAKNNRQKKMRWNTPPETPAGLALSQLDPEDVPAESDPVELERKIEIPVPGQRFNKWE